jgi:chemotaxis protein MotA
MKRLNKSLIFGFFAAILAISSAIILEIEGMSAAVFLHPVGLIAVFGGICATAFISTPIHELKRILQRTYYVIRFPRNNFMDTLRETMSVSVGLNRDIQYLEKNESKIKNMMLKDGLTLMSMGYKSEDIRRLMEIKREQNETALGESSVFFFSMAKMGPAFGLLGTLIGLIILLYYHMSSGDMSKIASSMGIALTATLYGVGVANVLFSPLADYLQYNAERGVTLDSMIIEAVAQIKERRHPVYLLQALKSYMPREDYDAVEKMMQNELLKSNSSSSTQSGTKGDSAKKAA